MRSQLEAERRADEVDALRRQCDECELGKKPIGPKSGCDVRKKLVIDQSEVAWKHKHLFFNNHGRCKMFRMKRGSHL